LLVSLTAAVLMGLSGCIRDPFPPAVRQQVNLGLIDGTDLPFGWGYRSGKPLDVPGGYGQDVGFHGADPAKYPFVLVTQTLEIYPDETASRVAYQIWVDRAIPPAYVDVWVQPPELDFRGNADEMKIACMSVHINSIPTQSCKVTARYGKLVTTLWGNVFEDRWLTMPQFRRLVERLDQRMQAARAVTLTPTPGP
jgi:hypothetical protein